jgi:hypothetical protein
MAFEECTAARLLAVFVIGCTALAGPTDVGDTPPDQRDPMPTPRPGGNGDVPRNDPPPSPPPAPQACDVAGQTFPDGSSIPSNDRCTRCTCDDGRLVCNAIPCEPIGCEPSIEAPDGICSRSALDPCISQDPDCGTSADAGACKPGEQGPDCGTDVEVDAGSCQAAAQTFQAGSTVPSGDACNTCACNQGSVTCTDRTSEPVFCALFVEAPDGTCSRFQLDPCISQDPDCVSPEASVEPSPPLPPADAAGN